MMRRFTPIALAAAVVSAPAAHAQVRPDAGMLRQQIEREREFQLPERVAPEKPAEPPAMTMPSGATVTVRAFQFRGNTLLSADQLAPAVAGYLNRPLDFSQLQAATAAVARVYRDAGWVVRAYLPSQEISEGVVTIQIVEAVFGDIRLEGEKPAHVAVDDILAIVDAQIKKGEHLSTDAVDRALLLADDLPGAAVSGALVQGTRPGETDLALKLADKPAAVGDAGIDDGGSRSTGAIRGTANVSLNSPFGLGDLLTVNTIQTRGSSYGRLAASLPVGADGLRIGANGSLLTYNLVGGDFAPLQAKGTSDSGGLEATYPIVRARLENLFLSANLDHKTFNNQSGGATVTRYAIDAATVGLNGNLFDDLAGGGANTAGVTLATGNVDLGGSPNQAADAATTRTAGWYGKLRYSASRQQVITEDVSLFAALSGQGANKNLDSSEKFFLGGPTGVRAYPVDEGGGSEGTMANLEVRQKLPEGVAATGFFDWGRIIVNRNNGFSGGAGPNGYSLKGAGLSLAWMSDFGLNLKATWSHRIGGNPNPTATGRDQDGSLDVNRWWVSATQAF
jgi:hemolysin activation/secretion protein